MLEDILEESWTYKEIARKGMEKGLDLGLQQGLEKGLEQGREKGREEERQQRIHEQQETLLSFVQMRFPEALHNLIVQLFGVQTADEARQALMEAGIQK
jgi:flagellar biosynthesis/type III secretory pathway protein FliH